MNKAIVLLLAAISIIACKRTDFVEHKLTFQKVADDCKEQQGYFRLNSNFGGERYEFEKCLPEDFKKEDVSSGRRGDTVVVNFKNKSSAKNVVYHLTLDIDSYPRYNYIDIDGDTYSLGEVKK